MTMAETPEADRAPGAPHPREAFALFGQQAAEAAFLDAWGGGRLHHAWLLRGPRGVGKATLAYRIARTLLIHGDAAPDRLDADPDHPVSRRILAQSEPRLLTLRRPADAKTGRLKRDLTVDEVRRLTPFFGLSAADGGWRAVVIDAADDMNASAANALLKTLEEPPPRAVLLLVAHAPGSLPPTIRSRCRTLDLRPLAADDMASALAAAGADPGADAGTLAALSGGSPGAAMRLAHGGGAALYARLARLLGGAPGIDRSLLLEVADACAGRGDAESRFALTCELTVALLHRLARNGAGAAQPEATLGEARLAQRLWPHPARARLWAAAASDAATRAARARAVNLDPAGAILDMWLAIDAVAARATGD
ncbi:MAG: DNA polymerase III subunit delta' [Rubrimonas sp.]